MLADAPRPCHGRSCPCVVRRVKWVRCTSAARTVAHLAVLRPRRGTWWHHLEQMGVARFGAVRNGSVGLSAALVDIAEEQYAQGEWAAGCQGSSPRLVPM